VALGPLIHVIVRVGSSTEANANAEVLLDQIASSVSTLNASEGEALSLAMPGPFDYARGIGRYKGIGKFESLDGVNVALELKTRLGSRSGPIVFLNDAEAFLLGEWSSGALEDHERAVAITIGTGIGSAFLINGEIVREGSGVPLDGAVHNLRYQGAALEDVVSRRCLREAYLALRPGSELLDVSDIAQTARAGDDAALQVFVHHFTALREALATTIDDFASTVLVVGGGISQSWELIEAPLRSALTKGGLNAALELKPAMRLHESALIGAAIFATKRNRIVAASPALAIDS
jgi:glucokinase